MLTGSCIPPGNNGAAVRTLAGRATDRDLITAEYLALISSMHVK